MASTSCGKRHHDDRDGGRADATKRPTLDKRENSKRKTLAIPGTLPHDGPRSSVSNDKRVSLLTNYFRLEKSPQWSIHHYHLTFEPDALTTGLRKFLVYQHKSRFGAFVCDGSQIFSVKKLHENGENSVVVESTTRDEQTHRVKLNFTREIPMDEERSLQILNLIIRRAEAGLDLQLVGRNYYDARAANNELSQFRIQLWPGYETSIREYENDLLLNCDVAHKVMRIDTVYTMLRNLRRDGQFNIDDFKRQIIGKTVLTPYNNRTYRIDDVDFDVTPRSTFKKGDDDVTYQQYFQGRYQVRIEDPDQPMLVVIPKERDRRGGQNQNILLVPELCRMTGLDEKQRTNMDLKKAMKPFAQMPPKKRIDRLIQFNRRIHDSEKSMAVLNEWGLEMDKNLVKINGRQLEHKELLFGKNQPLKPERGSWDDAFRKRITLYDAKLLSRWYIICPKQLERETNNFLEKLKRFGGNMGMDIRDPRIITVQTDRDMLTNFRSYVNDNPKFILFITGQDSRRNSDWYGSIKKNSFDLHTIPTQVVTRRSISDARRLDSIVTKIAIQINSKLGGLPWLLSIPQAMNGVMTVGFDIAKDTGSQRKFGCLVATMDLRDLDGKNRDEPTGHFYSTVCEPTSGDCSGDLGISMNKALTAYQQKYATLPERIIFYRGGVGDGDLQYVRDVEVAHLTNVLKLRYNEKPLKLAYMVVIKKINTRFFKQPASDSNPDCGILVDDVITLKQRYEFFLVSQQITQGTATPTNYNIIYDTVDLTPMQLQKWTWFHTHLYYNWCGTTRVPAVLQYAMKLGFLVSNYMHRPPNDNQSDKLYFL